MAGRQQVEDELLVLHCQEGSSDAFQRLVRRWQPRLLRHARRLTGREDAAWDVVQDTWVAVVAGLQRLSDAARFRRWLYTIATRRATDWRRRRRPDETAEELDETTLAAPPANGRDAVGLLREALRHLPGDRQALLSLRYREGFALWEMAEILGVPEGTVKSRLHHARRELRDVIERIER